LRIGRQLGALVNGLAGCSRRVIFKIFYQIKPFLLEES
jgi:hypothetical protein